MKVGCNIMDVTCISDVFKFIHRVMNLEIDESTYYDDSCDEIDEEGTLYEDYEGQSQ